MGYRKSRKAVTIIELIMVIVVVGVLAGALSLGIREAIDLWSLLSFQNEIVSQGRVAMMRMGREIRQMPSRTSVFEPIQVADAAQLRFTVKDLNGDGNDDTLEFYRDAGNNELMRIFNDSPALGDILASDVTNLTFDYYNQNSVQLTTVPLSLADRSNIYRIVITVTLSGFRGSRTLRTQIFPRNLG